MNASLSAAATAMPVADEQAPLSPLPELDSAMAASYCTAAEARVAEMQLRARWGLRATLLTAPLNRMDPVRDRWNWRTLPLAALALALVVLSSLLGALAMVLMVLALAAVALFQGSRLAFDALVARAQRRGHAVLVVPQVPAGLHEDVAALLVTTGVSWWDGRRLRW